MTDAARIGLPAFLKGIPQEWLRHFGFASQAELEIAELGTPFRQFTITPERILDYDPATPLDDLVLPLPIWHFPVVVGGEARTLLSVEMMHGEWRAVGIGSAGVARLWDAAQKARPARERHSNIYVKVYQARAAFVLSTRDGVAQMIPLRSAGVPPGQRGGRYDPARVIEDLQPAVRHELEAASTLRGR